MSPRVVHVEGKHLARFRVDPEKVRVSIRRTRDVWMVCVATRDGMYELVCCSEKSPKKALVRCLHAAEESNMPGIDLGMDCSYEHPWGSVP